MWQYYKKAKTLLNRDNENYDPNTAVEFLIESAKLGCNVAKYRLSVQSACLVRSAVSYKTV